MMDGRTNPKRGYKPRENRLGRVERGEIDAGDFHAFPCDISK